MLKKLIASAIATVALLAASALPAQAALTYFYSKGYWVYSSGTVPTTSAANITIWKPTITSGDFHSLGQIAIQSDDQQQAVEVGWTVNPALNGDNEPHVFVHWYKDGVACGYNGAAAPAGCGSVASPWVDNAANTDLNAGSELTESIAGSNATITTLKVGIDYSTTDCGAAPNGWWVRAYYSTGTAQYLGCFKDTNWTGTSPTFNNLHVLQAYGEVAANVSSPTTLMGSGVCPAAVPVFNTTAFIGSVQADSTNRTLTMSSTDSTKYKHVGVSASSFYYGGDGSC